MKNSHSKCTTANQKVVSIVTWTVLTHVTTVAKLTQEPKAKWSLSLSVY